MRDDSDQTSGPGTLPEPCARRKLVRGAFAAPVALTLHSGSAFAAASATCVARQVANPVVTPSETVAGTWLRVPVWKLNPTGTNNNSRWVSGSDILAISGPGSTNFIESGQWYCIFRQSGASTVISPGVVGEVEAKVGDILDVKPSSRGTGGSTSVPVEAQPIPAGTPNETIVVRFNERGDIVGVVGIGDTHGSSAVAASCWSSFRP